MHVLPIKVRVSKIYNGDWAIGNLGSKLEDVFEWRYISALYRYLINCNYAAIPVPRERVRETCMAIFGYFGRFWYSLWYDYEYDLLRHNVWSGDGAKDHDVRNVNLHADPCHPSSILKFRSTASGHQGRPDSYFRSLYRREDLQRLDLSLRDDPLHRP